MEVSISSLLFYIFNSYFTLNSCHTNMVNLSYFEVLVSRIGISYPLNISKRYLTLLQIFIYLSISGFLRGLFGKNGINVSVNVCVWVFHKFSGESVGIVVQRLLISSILMSKGLHLHRIVCAHPAICWNAWAFLHIHIEAAAWLYFCRLQRSPVAINSYYWQFTTRAEF